MDTMLRNVEKEKKAKKEKDKKKKTKMKQDEVDIKPVTLQDLMTKVKMIKQEIVNNEGKKHNSLK